MTKNTRNGDDGSSGSILGYWIWIGLTLFLLWGILHPEAGPLNPKSGSLKKSVPEFAGIAVRVFDGDTLTIDGERIRLANIDTPELFSPHCDAEKRLARMARLRLAALVGDGSGLDISRELTPDRYGRTLATISIGGRDIGQTLIDEGLAASWEGHRHNWCCQ